jgi:NAD(P)H dehydrogenase (quinone)
MAEKNTVNPWTWQDRLGFFHPSFGPRLAAVTTLGSPWWVDRLLLRQPVKQVLKSALLGACAPTCRFKMRSLYKCEQLPGAVVDRSTAKITRRLRNWK